MHSPFASSSRSAPRRFCAPPFLRIAILGSLLLTASSAHAQNSGGGWVAQLPPGAPNNGNTSCYDWTGFTISGTTVNNDGTSNSGSYTYYSVFAGRGVLVGNMYNRSSTTTSSGASTYEWLWAPTGSNIGAPPPPLYVLADASSVADFSYGSSAKGLSGSGTLSYGSVVSDYFSGTASASQVTLYKVLLASGSPNVSVSIGPVINHSYSGTPTGDYGVVTEVLQTGGCPIVLANPDPMGRPDLGDGKNQFTYGTEQPNGQLTVPASVYVPGASTAGTTFLLPHVSLAVSPVMQTGAQPFVWAASGAGMFVNTTSARLGYATPWPSGDFCYIGLPPNNTYFGNHVMTMNVDGQAAQTAKYQLFFNGTASNWPNSDGVTPNWYNYYQQVAPASILYDPTLSAGGSCTMGYFFNHNTKQYTITGDVLAMGSSAARYSPVPVFDVGPSGLIQVAGTVKIKGILSYLYVYGHELGHLAAYTQRVQVPYIDGTPPAGVVDSDGDGVPDAWEIAHHLDPEDPDTAKYYTQSGGVDNGKGDAENLASMIGLGRMVQYSNLWQQDWADLGIQYGKQPTYVPFEYDPLELSQYPSNGIPSNALTNWP